VRHFSREPLRRRGTACLAGRTRAIVSAARRGAGARPPCSRAWQRCG
jgi:hypothetical protein